MSAVRQPSGRPSRLARLARRPLVGARLAALGTTGVVAGHMLAYAFVEPDAHRRASLLHETGHAYWSAAITAAVVTACWSLTSHAIRQFRAARSTFGASNRSDRSDTSNGPNTSNTQPESIARAGARLAAFQVAVYASMELLERTTVDYALHTIFAHDLFVVVVGVAAQAVVACVLVQLLRLVGRAAVALARKLARPLPRRRPAVAHHPRDREVPFADTWDRPGPSRAPPAFV